MDKLAMGILAHVDAGKTTLSEAALYRSGALKKLGRVDHQNAFLDTDLLERERGITIFSKQAVFSLGDLEVTLLDTPGHVDFSAEMERTLQILDYAILVVSGTDGVQGHTRTLWRLLSRYRIPTFLFINKMDLSDAGRGPLLASLAQKLDGGCVDFSAPEDQIFEEAALCDEDAMAHYLESGVLSDDEIAGMIRARKLFPCFFGSALKLDGVDPFLAGIRRYCRPPAYPAEFGAKIFKIARDPQGNRLTYLKVTGGTLRVKAPLTNRRAELPESKVWEEKADQIRVYSGAKYRTVDEAPAGTVCAVTGLSKSRPGEGLGREAGAAPPMLEPVLTYRLALPDGCDPHPAMLKLAQLEDEDPQLHIVWNEQLQEIHIQLMGEVQMEILSRRILERFGLRVSFGAGNIVYRETIAAPVEGVGHYEPLRHYAEVHLLLEPGKRGSGISLAADCGEDMLDRNWQRLILTHLEERSHPGVLTGSPITDIKITLVAGRAHEKHTEGGDFRQATYRAVRQGLMRAQSVLLEPWYAYRLELPSECVGRAMSDIQRMSGGAPHPETFGEETVLTGSAPVSELQGYAMEVAAYTKGRGRLFCTPGGYAPCHNQEDVTAAVNYDPERDLENPADSVFCSHGAGFTVKWNEVPAYMHLEAYKFDPPEPELPPAPRESVRTAYSGTLEQDKELLSIFERTYGGVNRETFLYRPRHEEPPEPGAARESGPEYLLVDGYNIIYAWDELKAAARDNLDAARQLLMDLLSNYQGFKKCQVILVFDAYKVPGNAGAVSRYHNIFVVFTKEAETADAYIEKTTYEIAKKYHVRVATSDGPEQLIILGHGALRLSAKAFHAEVEQVGGQIAAVLERTNRRVKSQPVKAALEKALKDPPSRK